MTQNECVREKLNMVTEARYVNQNTEIPSQPVEQYLSAKQKELVDYRNKQVKDAIVQGGVDDALNKARTAISTSSLKKPEKERILAILAQIELTPDEKIEQLRNIYGRVSLYRGVSL